MSVLAAGRRQDVFGVMRDRAPAPPPWPDPRMEGPARRRLLAALQILREASSVADVVDRVRRLGVTPEALVIRVQEYGLAMIRAASDAQLEVIADYPSPALIAAMEDPAALLGILADARVAAKVAEYQAATVPDGPSVGHRPWGTPPVWRSALGRPLKARE